MVPKWVLAVVALVVTLILAVDVGGQIWIQGHTANPLVVGGAFTLFMALFTAAKGPKPPPDDSTPSDPEPSQPAAGRHAGRHA